jgi:hypothetical protein
MGVFRKKSDPVAERAKALDKQIADIEKHIRPLAGEQADAPPPAAAPPPSAPAPLTTAAAPTRSSQPRLRSTAYPLGPLTPVAATAASPLPEPVFEKFDQNPFRAAPGAAGEAQAHKLGMRRHDLGSAWQRFKTHFRGPPASNPRLVNYLAAGSIQGLRPLRYEKRVARNRVIFLVVVLVLFLLGIVAMLVKR